MSKDQPLLQVNGLTKRFGGFAAVNDMSFHIREGEILGLIGPNGSGKSTTFNMIAGAYKPTSGSIRLDGREIGGLQPNDICRMGVARTFQIPRPFRRLSILDNVIVSGYYGQAKNHSRKLARQRADEALELVGLAGDRHAMVDGLGAAGLKKLELARALATNPRLLLADESLGGLDEKEMDQAADMLKCIRSERKITIIWVEHIMGVLMRVVERVIVLDAGQKIADGEPNKVAHDPKVIEVYLGSGAKIAQSQSLASAEARGHLHEQ